MSRRRANPNLVKISQKLHGSLSWQIALAFTRTPSAYWQPKGLTPIDAQRPSLFKGSAVAGFPGWRIREAKAALSGWNALLLQMSRASDAGLELSRVCSDASRIGESRRHLRRFAERSCIAGQRRRPSVQFCRDCWSR